MKTIAAIDIGAGTLKLQIAQLKNDNSFKILENASYPLRLGKDTFIGGTIKPHTLELAIKVLKGFKAKLSEYQVDQFRIVATSAVREAKNQDFFVEQVRLHTGFKIEVLERSEEQRLIFLGFKHHLAEFNEYAREGILYIKAGSGNVELFITKKGNLMYTGTLPVGGLRLRENLKEVPTSFFSDVLEEFISSELRMLAQNLPAAKIAYVIGSGTILRWMHSLSGNKKNEITVKQLESVYEDLKGQSRENISERFSVPLEYADLLLVSAYLYLEFLRRFKSDKIIYEDISFTDSLLFEQAKLLEDKGLLRKIWKGAIRIGRKYRFDEKHSLKVSRLAIQIYDELQELHNYPSRYRFLLRLAALWHDLGIFIKNAGHHKHSFYIISNLEVPGLTANDMHMIATIARYHRKSLPKKYHHEYSVLNPRDRIIVSKLASFLRIADALDRGHSQLVEEIQTKVLKDRVVFQIRSKKEARLEKLYFEKKKDLFVELFGIETQLTEML